MGDCEFAYFTGFPGGSLQVCRVYNAPRWLTMPLAEITVMTISIPFSMRRPAIAFYDHYYRNIISIIIMNSVNTAIIDIVPFIVISKIIIINSNNIIICSIMLTYVNVILEKILVENEFQLNILIISFLPRWI